MIFYDKASATSRDDSIYLDESIPFNDSFIGSDFEIINSLSPNVFKKKVMKQLETEYDNEVSE